MCFPLFFVVSRLHARGGLATALQYSLDEVSNICQAFACPGGYWLGKLENMNAFIPCLASDFNSVLHQDTPTHRSDLDVHVSTWLINSATSAKQSVVCSDDGMSIGNTWVVPFQTFSFTRTPTSLSFASIRNESSMSISSALQ